MLILTFLVRRVFLESADYILHAVGPSGWFFNYSDSGSNPGIRPELYWFAQKVKRSELIWWNECNLRQHSEGKLSVLGDDRLLPLLLLWRKADEQSTEPLALSWAGDGVNPVSFHRSSWTDRNASFVGLKGGSPGASHGHMDVGQFVMESDGVRWAVDLGSQSYHELESAGLDIWSDDRWKVFRFGNMSHSVLVVDEAPQVINGQAPITRHQSNETLKYSVIDTSSVYAGQLKSSSRGVALYANGSVQIEDLITIEGRETKLCWSMVTLAEIEVLDASRARLSQDGEALMVEVFAPSNAVLEVVSMKPTHAYDAPNPGAKRLCFTLKVPAAEELRIAVSLIPETASPVTGERLPMSDW
ncbi:heparinase II/III family protein [Coraliomargarita algicola]|uniref:Heparinase II/III family protein n=1 Tax=Coraliomargarita algicola TaxID=3092156 RepID=A0ABZ0RG26_9BACT|nr:heparinase II/III family protein [Coraliomargarita sp. J2-16]WPJ95115.1 heparinase II/III family protein [Coraliomargarita sp. J2-16]